MPMQGWILAIWVPVLCLHFASALQAFRWLRTGQTRRHWPSRPPKSRSDAYCTVAFAGLFAGIFIQSPATPWFHWIGSQNLPGHFVLALSPMVVLPVVLLLVARLLDSVRLRTSA